MTTRVAINGFGRIGRLTFRHLMDHDDVEVVAINDPAPLDNLAYLLRHDSVHTEPDVDVRAEENFLRWGDETFRFLSERDPTNLPWSDLEVGLVIESSGFFTKREDAAKHMEAGTEKVLISAPGKGVDLTICLGINHRDYDPNEHDIVSNASCTTNCLSPLAKVLNDTFGIESGYATTVHAVTSSQALVDSPHKKWTRGRSALASIVPTTTGAAVATTEVLPELEGRLDGIAMRVPVPNGSIVDFVCHLSQDTTAEEVNDAFKKAAASEDLEGILGFTDEPLVSADIIGSPFSALVDGTSTGVVQGNLVKVLGWYDNEWGYAKRLAELADYVASR